MFVAFPDSINAQRVFRAVELAVIWRDEWIGCWRQATPT
jgi:hypothetical protein